MKHRILSLLTACLLCSAPLSVRAYSDPAWMYGDVNTDNTCNASDASEILLHAAAVGTGSPGRLHDTTLSAADMNGDGTVNASDAAEVLIYAAAKGAGSKLTSNDFVYQRRLPVTPGQIPAFSGKPYTVVHNGEPYFSVSDFNTSASFEDYSTLDSLGRCRVCTANLGKDLMPTEPRGEIGMVKPTGWHTVRYDGLVEGSYLYNRSHLIAFSLAGENANVQNLITGTRWFNAEGMLPFEEQVGNYIRKTGNHVLYRVTPLFERDELVARGVLMEAYSLEDAGAGVKYCVFCYNMQPGIIIDYPTGENRLDPDYVPPDGSTDLHDDPSSDLYYDPSIGVTYVCNTNSRKFHEPGCASVPTISAKNRKDVSNTAEELIALGYTHCKSCD